MYRVIQWATGSVGRTTLRRIIDHPDLELVAAVDFGRARGDFSLRKVTHRITQRVNVFAQLEVESGKVVHRVLLLQ